MKRNASFLLLGSVLAPGIALASTPKTFADLANQIVQLLGSATTDLIVLAIVVYFWGVTSNLFKQGGDEARSKLHQQLLWGIFVIFLAVSIWGVIQLLQSTFFGANTNGTSSGNGNGQNCTGVNCQMSTQ